jgi:hypothetical protein
MRIQLLKKKADEDDRGRERNRRRACGRRIEAAEHSYSTASRPRLARTNNRESTPVTPGPNSGVQLRCRISYSIAVAFLAYY